MVQIISEISLTKIFLKNVTHEETKADIFLYFGILVLEIVYKDFPDYKYFYSVDILPWSCLCQL